MPSRTLRGPEEASWLPSLAMVSSSTSTSLSNFAPQPLYLFPHKANGDKQSVNDHRNIRNGGHSATAVGTVPDFQLAIVKLVNDLCHHPAPNRVEAFEPVANLEVVSRPALLVICTVRGV